MHFYYTGRPVGTITQLVQQQPLPSQAEMFRSFMIYNSQMLKSMQETNLNITSLVTAVARLTGSQTDSTNANANPVAINKKHHQIIIHITTS